MMLAVAADASAASQTHASGNEAAAEPGSAPGTPRAPTGGVRRRFRGG